MLKICGASTEMSHGLGQMSHSLGQIRGGSTEIRRNSKENLIFFSYW
jgi:hypothetical protein